MHAETLASIGWVGRASEDGSIYLILPFKRTLIMALLDSPATLSAAQSSLVSRHNAAVATITAAGPFVDQNDVNAKFPLGISTIAGARKILADALMAEVQALTLSTTNRVLESGQDARLKIAETRRRQLEDYSSSTLPFGLNLLTLEFTS